ncbi:unnamed protein product, partial [Rotaria sp. Silwood2]
REDNLRFDYYDAPTQTSASRTTTFNNFYDEQDRTDNTQEEYRNQLIRLLMYDTVLTRIISSSILQSYTNDSVRVLCAIIEKNFHDNQIQCEKTINFVSRWLTLIDDDNEKDSFNSSSNRDIWRLAHIYTLLEYEQNDIFSLYSACRITENLDRNQSFYNDLFVDEEITRSKVRENLFRLMFHHLWTKLCDLCQTNENPKQWIHSYTLISKYYPLERVLQRMEYAHMKLKIEFMNLVYLILLNEKTPQPIKLIQQLLNNSSLIQDDMENYHINVYGSSCLQLLTYIIQTIDQYFEKSNSNNSTLMIDIQQWIISTLKGSKRSSHQEIITLLKFLNQPTCHLSLPMKQFLFDELVNISIENNRQDRMNNHRQFTSFWDHLCLLSLIIECITNENIENYQIPYHPSIITNENQNYILIDLYFFHLRRLANDETIRLNLINKILLSSLPKINDVQQITLAQKIFQQLKEYFLLHCTALLLCQIDLNNQDQQRLNHILMTIINQYLTIPLPILQLSNYVELFCSIIITKRSWNFLLNLLKSDRLQRLNSQWADNLHNLLKSKHTIQRNKYLQYSHQLQFTLTTDITSSIFPTLHQPYHELTQLIDQCVKNNNIEQRWIPLTNWIQSKLYSNPPIVNAIEIKVMLLLNIYYDYYCNAQLKSLDHLLTIIENILQPTDEERRVFRILLKPEQNMIGYTRENNHVDKNHLNDLFEIDCQDDDELPIRHILVNLLAMILLGGKENTLWTFVFEPLKLLETFGEF